MQQPEKDRIFYCVTDAVISRPVLIVDGEGTMEERAVTESVSAQAHTSHIMSTSGSGTETLPPSADRATRTQLGIVAKPLARQNEPAAAADDDDYYYYRAYASFWNQRVINCRIKPDYVNLKTVVD